MSGCLLDVDVLIALLDPTHVHHDRAHHGFGGAGNAHWISCPTTQNGTVGIVSHPKYPNPQPVSVVLESLERLTRIVSTAVEGGADAVLLLP